MLIPGRLHKNLIEKKNGYSYKRYISYSMEALSQLKLTMAGISKIGICQNKEPWLRVRQ